MSLAWVLAAIAGLGVGIATHRLNHFLQRADPDAIGPPLPLERLWAPLLDTLLFGLVVYRFGLNPAALVRLAAVGVLVQVLVFDARHRLILNVVIYPSILVAVLGAAVNPLLEGPHSMRLLYALAGGAMGGGLFLFLSLVSRGGIGLGDAKLMFLAGLVLGSHPLFYAPILRAIFLGVLAGGIGAAVFLATRRRGMRDFIPYGPFLVTGVILVIAYPCGLLGPSTCPAG
ncbi:MAG: prepilin peptidase [Candidatus Dormibacteria bacterium]